MTSCVVAPRSGPTDLLCGLCKSLRGVRISFVYVFHFHRNDLYRETEVPSTLQSILAAVVHFFASHWDHQIMRIADDFVISYNYVSAIFSVTAKYLVLHP